MFAQFFLLILFFQYINSSEDDFKCRTSDINKTIEIGDEVTLCLHSKELGKKIAYKIKADEYTIVTINEGFKHLKPEEQEDTPKDESENESKRYLRRMLLEPNYENEEEKFSENDYLTAENSSTPTEPEEEEINDNPDDKSRIVAQIGDIITKYPSVNKFLYNLI